MMQPQAPAKLTKLNRVERNAWTKQKLFDAATKVVGKSGYAEASVARITGEAGVAQGTFYNDFESRQELLDQLLPKIGLDMLQFIRARTSIANAAKREMERLSAFFDFIPICRRRDRSARARHFRIPEADHRGPFSHRGGTP